MKATDILTTNLITSLKLIIGTNGTGKTYTLIKEFKEKAIQSNVIFFTPYVNEIILDDEKILLIPANFIKNFDEAKWDILEGKTIVFDDCRNYLSTNIEEETTKKINNLLIARRFKNNNIYFVFHSFSQVPSFLYTFATHIRIHKTTESLQKVKNRIPNFELINEVCNIVNNHENKYFYKEVKI